MATLFSCIMDKQLMGKSMFLFFLRKRNLKFFSDNHLKTHQNYGRPMSAFGLFNESTTSPRDRSDTPTLIAEMPQKLQFNSDTPLSSSQNENQAQGPPPFSRTTLAENKQNVDPKVSEQKINLGNTEVTAQTKLESPVLKSSFSHLKGKNWSLFVKAFNRCCCFLGMRLFSLHFFFVFPFYH